MGRSMKKLIISTILMAVVCSMAPAFAVIDSERLLNEDYLKNAGYSPEAIRMIKIKSYDPYSPYEEPGRGKNIFVRLWNYIDPATESGYFGRSKIDPSIDKPGQW